MQKESAKDCIDHFIKRAKNLGLKITPQRCAVFRIVSQSKDHPTADQVFHDVNQEFPNISYDTVNRTLLTFTEIGLIEVVQTQGGPRRFDPVTDQHHHFQCLSCGKIIDFYNDNYDDLKIPDDMQKKFTVYNKRVVLSGRCWECRKQKKKSDFIKNSKAKN